MFDEAFIARTLIILICACLLSCASAKMSQELQQGKTSFNRGNYTVAFRQLLPLASEGNPEAEYAVGYMYYYGYGVVQDTETGIFWIRKAAMCHYVPAVNALAEIAARK